jgi:DNA-directed RNA polymerase subunit omega
LEIPGFVDSKFRLAILAAKRAKQIVNGSKRRVEINAENPLSIALEEIYRGKISFQIFEEEELVTQRNLAAKEKEEDLLESLSNVEFGESDFGEAEFGDTDLDMEDDAEEDEEDIEEDTELDDLETEEDDDV